MLWLFFFYLEMIQFGQDFKIGRDPKTTLNWPKSNLPQDGGFAILL